MIVPRNVKNRVLEAARDTPVVMLIGARQTGKSTLMQNLYKKGEEPYFVSLDDLSTLAAATSAPQDFIQQLPERVIIDEIQRVPELLLPIKLSVDSNRLPGRFFLTGSANVLSLPRVADSLAGRMEIHTLWPFSQGEIRGRVESFIDSMFLRKRLAPVDFISYDQLIQSMCIGGYPDVVRRQSSESRARWFASYTRSLIERDVRDIRQVEQLIAFPRLLALLASRAGGLLNTADLSRSLEMPVATVRNYLAILQSIFLVVTLRPWFSNVGKRLVKSPKIYLNDTGLLCHILGFSTPALGAGSQPLGRIFENFVIMECIKQIGWSKTKVEPFHFRTESGVEVDLVLEAHDGRLVAIECKASGQVGADAFSGLKAFKELTGAKFHRGIVLYSGKETLSFGKDLHAMPVSALWEL